MDKIGVENATLKLIDKMRIVDSWAVQKTQKKLSLRFSLRQGLLQLIGLPGHVYFVSLWHIETQEELDTSPYWRVSDILVFS